MTVREMWDEFRGDVDVIAAMDDEDSQDVFLVFLAGVAAACAAVVNGDDPGDIGMSSLEEAQCLLEIINPDDPARN